MRNLHTYFLIVNLFLFCGNLFAQEEPYFFEYNRIDYFAPSGPMSPAVSKTFKSNSDITIDFNLKTVEILTYFSDGPTESKYTIEKISELQSSKGKGQFYIITCQASNYATVVIELNSESKWVKRTIPHNGIYHEYYNSN